MANPEHIEILKRGENAWKTYIKEISLISMDLSKANLEGYDLRFAHLSGCDLRGANLAHADLRGAYLQGSNLSGAILSSANCNGIHMRRANLEGSILRRCRLYGAELKSANLELAELNGADLRTADLTKANLAYADLSLGILKETVFADTNLLGTRGLDMCEHQGASIVDQRTLNRSPGIPLDFLRGADLNQETIRSYIYGNRLQVEFQQSVWAQLFPVAQILPIEISKTAVIEKTRSRVLVKFDSPTNLKRAFQDVIIALAGLESISKGEVKSISVKKDDGQSGILEGMTLQSAFDRIESLEKSARIIGSTHNSSATAESRPLNRLDMSLIEGVRGVPFVGHLMSYWIMELLGRPYTSGWFLKFKRYFSGAKDIVELDQHKDSNAKDIVELDQHKDSDCTDSDDVSSS